MAADMVALEGLQIPTVTVTATSFLSGLQTQAKFSGLRQPLPAAMVPKPLTNSTPTEIVEYADAALEEIIDALIRPAHEEKQVEQRPKFVTYRGADVWEAFDLMNKSFLKYQVGDGFPVIPPTQKRVSAMLAATDESADKEVAVLGLGKGSATIEKIAINAVMAGCEPQHLPLIIAAVRGIADRRFYLNGFGLSSTAHSLMLIVNGPIVGELGINSGPCALGPGACSSVNIVIGRALRLILMNIAFQYPGITDLDYLGTGNKFSLCFAEGEDANPWEPLHVERGFPRDASTVTVLSVDAQTEARVATPDPETILRALAGVIAIPTTIGSTSWMQKPTPNNPLIVLSATHARNLAAGGWSKRDIKQFLYSHARVPAYFFKNCGTRRGEQLPPAWQWLNRAPDDTPVPIAAGPEAFQIVVVSSDAPKSAAFSSPPSMVTVPVHLN